MKIDNRVNGSTGVIGIIANPISHTKSPCLHNTLSLKLDDNLIYVPFLVKKGDVFKAIEGIRALNIIGINVTVPYKEKVIDYLDSVSDEARLIGAVNTIKNENGKLIGYNTDGIGFYRDLVESSKSNLKGKTVCILGAGGSSRAISTIAAFKGAEKIYIINRSLDKAIGIKDNINLYFKREFVFAMKNEDNILKHYINKSDVIVNTTPLGMQHNLDLSPVPKDIVFSKKQIIYDIVYAPSESKFIKIAKSFGCKTINGIGMLYYQGIEAYKIWTNRKKIQSESLNDVFLEFKRVSKK